MMDKKLFTKIESKLKSGESVGTFKEAFDNFKLMCLAVDNEPEQLRYASPKLRDNEELVARAGTLEFASARLRDDFKFAEQMIQSDPRNFNFLSDRLKDDSYIVAQTLNEGYLYALMGAGSTVRNDIFIAEMMLRNSVDSSEFYYLSDNLKANKELAEMAFVKNGMTLEYASDDIRSNKHLVNIAVTQNPKAIQFAHEKFKTDIEYVKSLVVKDGLIIEFLPDNIKHHPEIMTTAIAQTVRSLQFFDSEFKNTPLGLHALLMKDFIHFNKITKNRLYQENFEEELNALRKMIPDESQDRLREALLSTESSYENFSSSNDLIGMGTELIFSNLSVQSFNLLEKTLSKTMESPELLKLFKKSKEKRIIFEVPLKTKEKIKKNRKLGF
jgi:hypothetical protein